MTSDATRWRSGPLELELPPGWSASDDGETIEIVPPDAAGAAHVSASRRPAPVEVGEGDAERLLDDFLEDACVAATARREPERAAGPARAVVASYETARDDGERTWLVRMLAHRSGAVLCTFNQPAPGNPERSAQARTLLESVSHAEAGA